jgi:hypothetical protein
MNSRTALVAVTREKQATAELVAHQPFPIGRDTRPLHAEQCEALLTATCEWTESIPSFLFRNIALRDGGGCYSQLKEIAQQEFHSTTSGQGTFPATQFADFLEAAYRSGLLTKNFISPNGDIYSPDRVAMYEISPSAHAILAQHISTDIEARAATVPTIAEIDISHLREELAPILEHLHQRGPSVRDSMIDILTRSASDDEVQTQWDRFEDLIDQGIEQKILSQEESKLGASVLSIVT